MLNHLTWIFAILVWTPATLWSVEVAIYNLNDTVERVPVTDLVTFRFENGNLKYGNSSLNIDNVRKIQFDGSTSTNISRIRFDSHSFFPVLQKNGDLYLPHSGTWAFEAISLNGEIITTEVSKLPEGSYTPFVGISRKLTTGIFVIRWKSPMGKKGSFLWIPDGL